MPGFSTDRWKSFFYFDYERYRQKGGASQNTLSIPSLQERQGDFRDWRDASGNLIPIYDPATLRPDGKGGYIKDQFMGCDGKTPNVICPDRINPLVQPWLAALPTPTSAGALNNFLAPPIPDTILADSDYYMWRRGRAGAAPITCSPASGTRRRRRSSTRSCRSRLPTRSYSDPQNSWVNRLNYDKILTSTLVNHMSAGYLNRNEGYGCVNEELRRTSSRRSQAWRAIQRAAADRPRSSSRTSGATRASTAGNITTRPTFIVNDAVTWVKGTHTLKVGMEWRKIMGNLHANGNEAGDVHLRPRMPRASLA